MPRGERGMCNKSRRRKKNKKEGECGKPRAAAKINGKINLGKRSETGSF